MKKTEQEKQQRTSVGDTTLPNPSILRVLLLLPDAARRKAIRRLGAKFVSYSRCGND